MTNDTDETEFEHQVEAVIASISAVDGSYEEFAWERLDSLTKPPRSLGRLERIAAQVACIQHAEKPSVQRKAIVLAAGDHGVVAEGVSPYPQDVTWQMLANFSAGGAAINQIARTVGADVFLYDVGVASDVSHIPGVLVHKVGHGTQNMATRPAMTREECARAIMVGVAAARELAEQGYRLIGTGEMGIGNSTAAAALTAAYTETEPSDVVGPGTGLDAAGVAHKAAVIRRAFETNRVEDLDTLGVLAACGGYEIAMLAGVVLGCAEEGVCVVTDGYISGSATLAAARLCPAAVDYVLPSHLSAEPGHAIQMAALGLDPVLKLDMRLGEGTGAALAFGVIEAACSVMAGMATFAEAGVSDKDE